VFPQLLNSINEDEVFELIEDDSYLAQEKKDGQRRMAIVDESVIGLNKKGEKVQLPDLIILSLVNLTNEGCIIDGEIIGEQLFLFDVLSSYGKDLTNLSYVERLQLMGPLSSSFGENISIVKTAYTRAEKLKMYNDLKARNAEGIVFKHKSSKYVAGRPNSGGAQLKFKFYKEASFIVKDFTKGKRSVGLELIDADGNRVHMGKCTIPPNKNVPEIGSVVEVRYLYAYRGGKIFQPCYKEERNDVYPKECLMTQIIYKAGEQEEED
jgi:bifunctional non-homologous end joining protein LigD